MPDLAHQFGADLVAGATGDLAVVDGPALGRQRVLRRLLTNPGDYIWQRRSPAQRLVRGGVPEK